MTTASIQAAPGAAQQLVSLQQLGARLRVGSPLPFHVRDEHGRLLLARGQLIADAAMLQSLLARGAWVLLEELREARKEGAPSEAEDFFDRWDSLQARLGTVLRGYEDRAFLPRLRECVAALAGLAERSPDRLIFAVMRHDPRRWVNYGVVHAMHVAAVCCLLARRSNWAPERVQRLLGAALTMNLSIVDLQGELAMRALPLTPTQRQAIDAHPRDSAALLRLTGLEDDEWLAAVEQHHEKAGGGGYPAQLQQPGEMSQFLHFIDIFMAKHSGRACREPLPPQQAARELYTASGGHPVAALLIKEFGVFPPGCFVRLASGETAVVIKRGEHASMPVACALTNRLGDALGSPLRRDTANPAFSIACTLADKAVLVKVQAERLYKTGLS